ncbi:MAG: NUDIX hydrolase [Dissulfuribacterales bacterium]
MTREYPTIPHLAVSTVVLNEKEILAVKRRNPPAENTWALPGGSVKLGETLFDAAIRETLEETGVLVQPLRFLTAVDAIYHDEDGVVRFHYAIIYILAQYLQGQPSPRDDALEARWLAIQDLHALPFEKNTLKIIEETAVTQGVSSPIIIPARD